MSTFITDEAGNLLTTESGYFLIIELDDIIFAAIRRTFTVIPRIIEFKVKPRTTEFTVLPRTKEFTVIPRTVEFTVLPRTTEFKVK